MEVGRSRRREGERGERMLGRGMGYERGGYAPRRDDPSNGEMLLAPVLVKKNVPLVELANDQPCRCDG